MEQKVSEAALHSCQYFGQRGEADGNYTSKQREHDQRQILQLS